MIDQEHINRQLDKHQSTQIITPLRIATISMLNGFLVLAVALFFTYDALDQLPIRLILLGVSFITLTALAGYIIVRRGKPIIGLSLTIYGLIFGLTFISIFAEGLGAFTLTTLVLITTLSVAYAVPQRSVIIAISTSLVFGAAAMIFDLNFPDAAFRLSTPPVLANILWAIIFVMAAVFLYLIFRQFPSFPLRAKIISAFAIITILSLSILGFFNSRSVKNVLTQEANQALFNAAAQTENSLRQFLNTNLQSIKIEAQLPVIIQFAADSETERQELAETATQTLLTLAQKDSHISSYAVLDLQGNVLLDTDSANIGRNESILSAYSEPINNGSPMVSNVEMAPVSSEPSLYFSAPIIENGNIIIGVLRARYNASVLQDLIVQSNGRGGANSFAVLFDEYHIHLAHGIAPETIFTTTSRLDSTTYQYLRDARRLPAQTEQQTFLDLTDLDNYLTESQTSESGIVYFDATDIATEDQINRVVVLKMENPSWLLAFFQPKEIYLAPIEDLANNTIFLSLLSGFGTVLVAIILTQILVAPIAKLNESAMEISKGNLDTRVEITSDDEIGTLANTFNSMAQQLGNLVRNLENQVRERTRDIENRAAQLQAATEVARDATSELKLSDMLIRAASLIYEKFGFYHVGIYLKDPQGEYAILTASEDLPGKRLLENNHSTKIDVETNVGFVCILGEARLASVDEFTAPLNYNPLLPNSQAQMVLPLNIANQTIGVIDIHSTNKAGFTQDDLQIFQTLADQLAIAIEKARYNEEIQETLNELEAAYGTFTQKSWQRFIQGREQSIGYRYRGMRTEPVYETPRYIQKVWNEGEPAKATIASPDDPTRKTTTLSLPIKVRGEVISVLNLEFESDSVPPDINKLLEQLADSLSLILENARLIENAKNQVDREQLATHITSAIRQSLDMDVVLRTAVQEIGQTLNLPEVEIRLGTTEQYFKPIGSKRNGSGNGAMD